MVTFGEFADHIDQLDLALDQLAMNDRNFDRFALMLVDNVVELVLHKNAVERSSENKLWVRLKKPKYDQNAIDAALGRYFDAKVKFAKETKLLCDETAETIQYLHGFRNDAYHLGRRHEGILHSLSLLYFRTACDVLGSYVPRGWSGAGDEGISHRAMKYLGRDDRVMLLDWKKVFRPAFERLREVADAMGDALALDLYQDVSRTIDRVDQAIDFVEENQPDKPKKTRDQIVIDAQVWAVAFSPEALVFAAKKKALPMSRAKLIAWLATNYPLRARGDPVVGWRRRAGGIQREKNPHAALKKYCDFMAQTEVVREQIHAHAAGLDEAIQAQIDYLRGK